MKSLLRVRLSNSTINGPPYSNAELTSVNSTRSNPGDSTTIVLQPQGTFSGQSTWKLPPRSVVADSHGHHGSGVIQTWAPATGDTGVPPSTATTRPLTSTLRITSHAVEFGVG